jgi:hypothetical protein
MARPGISFTLFLFLLSLVSGADAQNAAEPTANDCASPESKQFDFWLGEWDLTWPGKHQDETLHGTNSIRRMLGGCVIQEQFDGGSANPLRGISLSVYNAKLQEWQQTWADNEATYMDFAGGVRDGQMVLEREARSSDGSATRQRMVYKNIAPDSFDWTWEQSKDDGKTWLVIWPIHYTRKKA